ncbi:hypothetical protein LZ32DRAFT_598907 [Colletotrichum eremochloae]|nr:hypothetical protein LZ32DRAFT_598907 [Colletotrichum eremochloae]
MGEPDGGGGSRARAATVAVFFGFFFLTPSIILGSHHLLSPRCLVWSFQAFYWMAANPRRRNLAKDQTPPTFFAAWGRWNIKRPYSRRHPPLAFEAKNNPFTTPIIPVSSIRDWEN